MLLTAQARDGIVYFQGAVGGRGSGNGNCRTVTQNENTLSTAFLLLGPLAEKH